jgi:hypothetical protein
MFWIQRLNIFLLNIFKMLIFPKLIYRFNIIPAQIPDGFFFENLTSWFYSVYEYAKGLE